jgi:predicted PurR-regulated permease PerM
VEFASLGYDIAMPTDEVRAHLAQSHQPSSHARSRDGHWALTTLGIAIILGLCYWGEPVLAVIMVSVLLAFILAPVMDFLSRLHLHRSLAAALAVILFTAAVGVVVYYSSNQAFSFVQDLSKYGGKVRQEVTHLRQRAEIFGGLNPPGTDGESQSTGTLATLLFRGVGSVTQGLIAASFVPFLVYFMLTWQHHVRTATVMLFPMENRHTAYVTLGLISAMIRSFMVGNLLIGVFLGIVSTIIFGVLGFPFFYFVGFISGFLSLVPYLGVVLAMAPPVITGIGQVESGALFGALVTVLGMHLIALNVLYPRFLGPRLQLNPLAVTVALLVWGWLWGAIGLVLAIPITAAIKIVFDHIDALKPYGTWLGE